MTKTERAAARAAFADHVYACSYVPRSTRTPAPDYARIANELRADGFYREAKEIEREHLNGVE